MRAEIITADAPTTTVRDVSAPHGRLPDVGPQTAPVDRDQLTRCVMLQLTLCGAAVGGDLMRFAAGIVEVLRWSAEHARTQAEAESRFWRCPACRERVPGNFDLCWNCESARPAEGELLDERFVLDSER